MHTIAIDEPKLEREIFELGAALFAEARASGSAVWSAEHYTDKLIGWAMENAAFRTALFRFVDVLPALEPPADVVRHAQEYFQPISAEIPGLAKLGLQVDPRSLTAKAVARVIRGQVRAMAERFIVGASPEQALPALREVVRQGRTFTVDLLGETTLSEAEAAHYLQRYLALIATLDREKLPPNISVKLSALDSQARTVAFDRTVDVLSARLTTILRAARAVDCFVYVDMEDSSLTDITLETVKRVAGSPEFQNVDRLGLVLQAYLRRTEADLDDILCWLKQRPAPIAVRLVKGAYWDTEVIRARLANWPVPVWHQKTESDAQFEKLSRVLLDNAPRVFPAFGSHNLRSLCHAIQYAAAIGLGPNQFEIQVLYGMGEPIKPPLVKRGFQLREYTPVGELIPGMGYLVRRLLENTSNQGFIRLGFHDHETPQQLLAKPRAPDDGTMNNAWRASVPASRDNIPTPAVDHGSRGRSPSNDSVAPPGTGFRNHPLLDFSVAGNRQMITDALERRRAALPIRVRPIIDGDERDAGTVFERVSPECTDLVVSRVTGADAAMAVDALARLQAAFPGWRDTPVDRRGSILERTAAILDERRADLIGLMILETGKPWTEADADVCEAIDFLRYYALQARALMQPRRTTDLAGEENIYFHEPRGVCAVISPWNFPVAIPCGMISAALVTGNCVAFKPAEQSSAVALELYRAFEQAGLPPNVLAFLPGDGEHIGPALVNSPLVSTIAFTGSKTVGLKILRAAADVQPGQEHVKRVIAEMGSKNAIIIDADADLDAAVLGVVHSAFGYAGQKCSAASRVVVLAPVYDKFIARLRAATQSLIVGPSSDPATVVGPVIDAEAYTRLRRAIAAGKVTARLVVEADQDGAMDRKQETPRETARHPHPDPLPQTTRERGSISPASTACGRGRSRDAGPGEGAASYGLDSVALTTGYYISPAVFTHVPPDDPLWRIELFGPVLAVVVASDFDEALRLALDTEYGLTGAVYSRSPRHLEQAARAFRVGNLYLNRGSPGAMVARQPFGGARLSGVGSKSGGPDYLQQFVIPRTISESTFRKGFAPLDAAGE